MGGQAQQPHWPGEGLGPWLLQLWLSGPTARTEPVWAPWMTACAVRTRLTCISLGLGTSALYPEPDTVNSPEGTCSGLSMEMNCCFSENNRTEHRSLSMPCGPNTKGQPQKTQEVTTVASAQHNLIINECYVSISLSHTWTLRQKEGDFFPPTSQEDERSDVRFPRITQQPLPKPRHAETTLFLERRGAMVFFIDKGSTSNEGVTGAGNFPIQYLP